MTRIVRGGALVVLIAVLVLAVAGGAGTVSAQESGNESIHTDYFVIEYDDGNRDEAEEIASYADAYYETQFQRFGVEPIDEKVPVRVVDEDDLDCDSPDARGCYKSGVKATIYVTSDSRSVFYHELTHRFQAKAMEGGIWINPPGSIDKPGVMVEGTARYLDGSPEGIAASASFREDDVDFATKDPSGEEYADLALFSEYVLHEYGREGFDVLYTGSHPRDLEPVAGREYSEIRGNFYDQLPEQESRLRDGGAPLPGFTYDPFIPAPGAEVTFDARTPGAIEALDRSWYDGRAESYEWDLDDDGEIEATGPTVTRSIADPANATVTLYVTVDGERHRAEQALLDSSMRMDRTELEPVFEVTDTVPGEGLDYAPDREADDEAVAGQIVTLNATIENRGLAGTEEIELAFADRELESRRIELDGGERRDVSLTRTIPSDLEEGTYDYELRLGNETRVRTVYVTRPEAMLTWDSISVRNGTEGWIENRLVKPGKRVEVTVGTPTAEENVELTETVEFRVGGETIDRREITFGTGSGDVRVTFTAPSEPGRYRIEGALVDGSSNVEFDGLSRHIEVKEQLGIATVQLESEAGACSARVTETEVYSVYKAEGGWSDPENVSEITPDDDVKWNINLMPGEECEGGFELPLDVGSETKTAYGSIRGPMEVYVDPAHSFDEAGEYEIRSGDVVLDTVTVTGDSGESTTSGQTDGDEDAESSSDGSETTDRDETATGEPDRSPTDRSEELPGFGVGTAVVALIVVVRFRFRR